MNNNYKVYMYKNNINQKKYIGQTCLSLSQRAGKNGIKYNNDIQVLFENNKQIIFKETENAE